MPQYLLDTCILIDYLRGKKAAIEFLEDLKEPPLLSILTVAELYAGVRQGEEQTILDNIVSTWHILSVDEQVARQGGLYRRDFHASHGIGIMDALIAATSLDSGTLLVTLNKKHFPMLENVLVPWS